MHFLARNNLKFKLHNKETQKLKYHDLRRVRYGVRSELCLALKHNRAVRECSLPVTLVHVYIVIHLYAITFCIFVACS